jgi:hypothetical protein
MIPWMGVLIGLYASSHIIKSLISIDIHYAVMAVVVATSMVKFILELNVINTRVQKDSVFLLVAYLGLIFYSILTFLISPDISSASSFIELILITLFFYIGKSFNHNDCKTFFNLLVLLSSIQAVVLIVDRGMILNNLENYLLNTLILGVVATISYIKIFERLGMIKKSMWLGVYMIHILAVLNMQSRGTAIFILLFTILYPFFTMSNKKLFFYIIIVALVGMVYWGEIISFYQDSILFRRVDYLVNNFENEQRFELYSIYFSGMEDMWLTGFGLGQSSAGIFGEFTNNYPHNFILEFASEFGVIGLLFIIVFLFTAYLKTREYSNKNEIFYKFSLVFCLYITFLFLKSFTIYDSYLLFFSFGLLWSFENKNNSQYWITR